MLCCTAQIYPTRPILPKAGSVSSLEISSAKENVSSLLRSHSLLGGHAYPMTSLRGYMNGHPSFRATLDLLMVFVANSLQFIFLLCSVSLPSLPKVIDTEDTPNKSSAYTSLSQSAPQRTQYNTIYTANKYQILQANTQQFLRKMIDNLINAFDNHPVKSSTCSISFNYQNIPVRYPL